MNFLLHRHFARRELNDAAAGFGAMLPDLVRMVDRRWRPRPDAVVRGRGDATLESVLDGIDHHLAIDLWFHRRGELHDGERRTVAAFRDAGATARRLPLFGHAAWEMLIDGAWVRRESASAVEDALRRECEALAGTAALAMALHGDEPAWSASPEAQSRLWRTVPVLSSGYASAEGMAARLDGLRASFGLGHVETEELARWHLALRSLEPHADEALAQLERARAEERAAAAAAPPLSG